MAGIGMKKMVSIGKRKRNKAINHKKTKYNKVGEGFPKIKELEKGDKVDKKTKNNKVGEGFPKIKELEKGDKVDKKTKNNNVGEGSSKIKELEKGDKVDLSKILGDRLISKQPPYELASDHLNGKVVVLHFVPLVSWGKFLRKDIASLVDIYNSIHTTLPFEVVFIGFKVPGDRLYSLECTKSYRHYFEQKFSIMPWTALPFSNTRSLHYWQTRLGSELCPSGCAAESSTFSLVIDSAGVVSQLLADNIFLNFGAEAYPFTDEKVIHLEHQDQKARNFSTITQLLTSPGRDHLITCEDKEVAVKDLEGKTVALYFYKDCYRPFNWFTRKLKKAYQKLEGKNFEVVLVYNCDNMEVVGYESEESFRDALRGMPWLALPYKHPCCKKLQRIFEYLDGEPVPRLAIIGPHGKFVEPYGADIVKHFGPEAYPFTRNEVVNMELDRIKKLKLDTFLDPNTYFEKAGSKVKFSQLAGKKIILIVEVGYKERPNFWSSLTQRYNIMKEMGDPFEVIHVPYKDTSDETSSTVPWLRAPPLPKNSHDLVRRVFRSVIGLLAFDGDGRVVRKTRYPRIQKGNQCFPFYDGGLENEVLKDLIRGFRWDDECNLVRGL